MKKEVPNLLRVGLLGAILVACGQATAGEFVEKTNAATQRVGVYDSRAVAYAYFWSGDYQHKLKEQMETAKAAKAAGDTAQFNKLNKALADEQNKLHRQVFSTAPANEALAALHQRIPHIQEQAGVSTLVSKWDKQALKSHASATQIDVTDLLVREFKPTDKQLKTIAEIRRKDPVPPGQFERLPRN